MLTVAKSPHAQASCAMLLDEQHCKATWVSLFTIAFRCVGLLTMLKCEDELQRSKAESIRGTYHRMEVFCLVFKAISIFFFFFEAVNVYRKQESYVDFCHLTTYTQCKPNLFNLSHTKPVKQN